MLSTEERNIRILEASRNCNPGVTNFSHDIGLPTKPVGHKSGMDTSLGIIRSYCKDHRKGSHHVEPQQVIDVLEEAGIKCWVLMGLYGYVGHLDMLRATQDVNVMVPYSQKSRAAKAVGDRLPMLRRLNLS